MTTETILDNLAILIAVFGLLCGLVLFVMLFELGCRWIFNRSPLAWIEHWFLE